MTGALIIIGGIVYIAMSIFFQFTPRLRVVVGLVVGSTLTGGVATKVNEWLANGIATIARPLGRWIGQGTDDVAVAIPSAIGLGLAIVVVVFLRGRGKGSAGAGGKGATGKSGGGGKAKLAHAALACALLLPIIVGSLGETIRGVSQ